MATFILLIFSGLVSYLVIVRGPEVFPILATATSGDLLVITYIILAIGFLVSLAAGNNRK